MGVGTTAPTKKLEVVGDATVSGNLSVGGTISYEDVNNIDSVGVITAQSGIQVTGGGLSVSGVSTFNDTVTATEITAPTGSTLEISGGGTGSANLKITFPQNDTAEFKIEGAYGGSAQDYFYKK